MIRTIVEINEDRCNGCGLCATACHEGAIGMVDGKAKLLRDDYCDGMGDCLPACPMDAISFIEREAEEYNEAAVIAHKLSSLKKFDIMAPHSGCPSTAPEIITHREAPEVATAPGQSMPSQLGQWPCQIKLVPINAPYFQQADLLIAADCTAFAYANIHQEYMAGKITLIGCPKLDDVNYTEKLTAIIRDNAITSVTVIRMQVPCCGGIQIATENALTNSGKDLPYSVVTVSTDGRII